MTTGYTGFEISGLEMVIVVVESTGFVEKNESHGAKVGAL